MRRAFSNALLVLLAGTLLFAVGAYGLWLMASHIARDKTIETLRGARTSFVSIAENEVNGVLWYACNLAMDNLGSTAKPRSVEFMRELARVHHMDEMNVVSSNGIVIASNFEKLVGLDWNRYEETREFLALLRPDASRNCCGQSFRNGIGNPSVRSTYYCVAYPDRSGLIQVAITVQHLGETIIFQNADDYRGWAIGQYGYYEPVDDNGDGKVDRNNVADHVLPDEGELLMVKTKDGEDAYGLVFPYAGLLYRAVVPMREYYEQRNMFVWRACLVAGVFFLVLTLLLVKISNGSARLDALHRRMEAQTATDLASARAIQLSSLQRAELFRVTDLDSSIAAVTYPAREVGGDLYGMFLVQNGKVALAVGDVSGKGVPAAMFMHIAKNTFELRVRAHDDLSEAVALANDYLCERNQAEMFVTGWFGTLDPSTGLVEYVNAGHNRPFVIRANGVVERVDGKGGRFLGVFPGVTYRTHRLKLNRGDRLFVYTDGVTEAMNGEKALYGEARLVSLLRTRPRDICKAVKSDVDAFTDGVEQSDDLTMLVLSYHGKPERIAQTFSADSESLGGMIEFVRGVIRFEYPKQGVRLLNALDEVLSNIVNYSGSSTVTVVVENVPGRCRVMVTDSGEAYNPMMHRDPNTHLSIQDRPIGGLGILMAKKLVSSVKYSRENGKNVLTLVQIDFSGKFRQIV